jgi:hypothetical protein
MARWDGFVHRFLTRQKCKIFSKAMVCRLLTGDTADYQSALHGLDAGWQLEKELLVREASR